LDDAPDESGVLWGDAEFTPRATQMLEAKELKYFSPVIAWGTRDKRTGESQGATLVSGALTLTPFLDRMPAIALSEGWEEIRGDAEVEQQKERNVKKIILADRVARTVRLIADDDTETMATVEGLEAPPKIVRLSDVKRDKDGKFDFTSLPQEEGVLIASDVFHGMQVQTELDAAVTAGKITPAQRPQFEKLALSDLAGFKTLVASMKPQVDLAERGTGAEGLTGMAQVQNAIDTKVSETMKAKHVPYAQALKLVASENADLFALKTQLTLKGGR
jgi:phage I-like protein